MHDDEWVWDNEPGVTGPSDRIMCCGPDAMRPRAITDYSFCTYLSDLAVEENHQRQGIGQELIRRTHEAAELNTTLILVAAPKAQAYYPHIGMTKHESCWIIPRQA